MRTGFHWESSSQFRDYIYFMGLGEIPNRNDLGIDIDQTSIRRVSVVSISNRCRHLPFCIGDCGYFGSSVIILQCTPLQCSWKLCHSSWSDILHEIRTDVYVGCFDPAEIFLQCTPSLFSGNLCFSFTIRCTVSNKREYITVDAMVLVGSFYNMQWRYLVDKICLIIFSQSGSLSTCV